MKTREIIFVLIIIFLIIGIIMYMARSKHPKDTFVLGQLVGTVTSLNPGQYMDKTSKLISDNGQSELYVDGKIFYKTPKAFVTIDYPVSYIVCKDNGIYLLDSNYNVTFSNKTNISLTLESYPQILINSIVNSSNDTLTNLFVVKTD